MARVVSFLSVLAVLAVLFVLFSCSSSPLSSNSVYVSTSGNDANDGLSPSTPVKTLVKAVEVANTMDKAINVVIKVSVGSYTPGDGLSSANTGFVINRPNVTISGGWSTDFSSVVGKSELDGNNSLYHIIKIEGVTNVIFENLVIRGGKANGSTPDDSGGGVYVNGVSYLTIGDSVVISNNSATNGGGISLFSTLNSKIEGNLCFNTATNGGGIYLGISSKNTISGNVYSNSAVWGGGGVFLWSSTNNTISGAVYSNKANLLGGGVLLYSSPNNTTISSVYANSANFYGGGLYLTNSDYFTNTGWITNNTAGSSGGGVYTNGSHPNSSFGNVANNTPNNFNTN